MKKKKKKNNKEKKGKEDDQEEEDDKDEEDEKEEEEEEDKEEKRRQERQERQERGNRKKKSFFNQNENQFTENPDQLPPNFLRFSQLSERNSEREFIAYEEKFNVTELFVSFRQSVRLYLNPVFCFASF